jgi:ankyrin repeat protein
MADLERAAATNDVEFLRAALAARRDEALKFRAADGSTLLVIAAAYGATECARTLLDAGASPDECDARGFHALYLAAQVRARARRRGREATR